MKQLSVRQPWASLIAGGAKTIETRTWATRYRGDVLVCSSKLPDDCGPAGVALCVARIVACRPLEPSDRAAAWLYEEGLWAWCLEDVRPVRPFPVGGRLGLRDVAPEVAGRIRYA